MLLNSSSGLKWKLFAPLRCCLATSWSGPGRAGSGGFGEVLLRRVATGGAGQRGRRRLVSVSASVPGQASERGSERAAACGRRGGSAGGRRGMGGALILMFCFSCPPRRMRVEAGWGGTPHGCPMGTGTVLWKHRGGITWLVRRNARRMQRWRPARAWLSPPVLGLVFFFFLRIIGTGFVRMIIG